MISLSPKSSLSCFLAAVFGTAALFPGRGRAAEVKENYPGGTPKFVYEVDAAGKKNGAYQAFFENGKTQISGAYVNDLKTGLWTFFYDTGKARLEQTYLAGKFAGPQTYHTPKGTTRATLNFAGGDFAGPVTLYDDAGRRRCLVNFPRSASTIANAWSALYPFQPLAPAYDVEPVLEPPYKAGVLKKEVEEQALNYLKLYRFLAGVSPNVGLDPNLSLRASAASVILHKIGGLNHTPPKPDDMLEGFYKLAFEGTSHSNIYTSNGEHANIIDSIRAYMDDSDGSNQSKVGHRQWLLNPAMNRTGFGFAPGYSATYAHAAAPGAHMLMRYTTFPSEGFYPLELIQTHYVWSLHFNPDVFTVPNAGAVKVHVERLDDAWEKVADVPTAVVSVFTEAGWPTPVIIFKPELKKMEPARYLVEITGLKAKVGDSVIHYMVEFISMADVKPKPPTTNPAAKPSAP